MGLVSLSQHLRHDHDRPAEGRYSAAIRKRDEMPHIVDAAKGSRLYSCGARPARTARTPAPVQPDSSVTPAPGRLVIMGNRSLGPPLCHDHDRRAAGKRAASGVRGAPMSFAPPNCRTPREQCQLDAFKGRPATEEDVMYPVITQAIAADRTREFRAYAQAAGRARQLRRSRRARHARLFTAVAGSGHGQAPRPAPQPVRSPRAA